MFGALRFGIRTFVIGLALGLLFAPRSGPETRRMLREKFDALVDELAELLVLPERSVTIPGGSPAGNGHAAQTR